MIELAGFNSTVFIYIDLIALVKLYVGMLSFIHVILLYLLSGVYLYENKLFISYTPYIWTSFFLALLGDFVYDSVFFCYLCIPLCGYFAYQEVMRVPTEADFEKLGFRGVYPSGSGIQLYLPQSKSAKPEVNHKSVLGTLTIIETSVKI